MGEFDEFSFWSQFSATSDARSRAELCEQALLHVDRDDNPTHWGNVQGILGASLAEAHGRRFTEEVFQKILQAYKSALSVFSPDESPDTCVSTLRNIGATHLDAADSGLEETKSHVEAAITAYSEAVTVSKNAEPDSRLSSLLDLASALQRAQPWRGQEALKESAGVYLEILRVLPEETSQDSRYSLFMNFADTAYAAGDASSFADAIEASEQTLVFFPEEKKPFEWANIQLMLSGFLRAQEEGNRADNLERAIVALDSALRVFNEKEHPREWIYAHCERGTVLVLRFGGDRNENLREAIKSLRIAVVVIPREQAPVEWSGIQLLVCQALLERTDDNPQPRIEEALPILETVLEFLPNSCPLVTRLAAMRLLAEAYLRREAGDEADNIEKSIALLEAVQEMDNPPSDPNGWTTTQANLGTAYGRRLVDERSRNREKAFAFFESVLSVDFEDGIPPRGWGTALSGHTLLSMKEETFRFQRQSSKQGEEYRQKLDDDGFSALSAEKSGEQPIALDTDWRVPFMIEQDGIALHRELFRFVSAGVLPERDAVKRSQLEIDRHVYASNLVGHLEERRVADQRTSALLQEIRNTGRPFILFLRGFNNRIKRFAEGSVVSGTGNLEHFAIVDLVSKVAPMPVVWVCNPVESPAIALHIRDRKPHEMGFRIEAGQEWERHVSSLMTSASFVVMHNESMTPGVVAEIDLLQKLDRLNETYFQDVDSANKATGRTDCRAIDEAALEFIANCTETRSPIKDLPPVMCPWVSGKKRAIMEREVTAGDALLERLVKAQQSILADLTLDVCAWSIGQAIFLERRDSLPPLFDRQAEVFENLEFDRATELASACSQLSAQLRGL